VFAWQRITSARGPPLWDDGDAQYDEGVQFETDWDLAAQAALDCEVDTILTDIARHAIVLTPSIDPTVTPSGTGPSDPFLWQLLNTRTDLVLVTGDKLLLSDLAMQQRIMLPPHCFARRQAVPNHLQP